MKLEFWVLKGKNGLLKYIQGSLYYYDLKTSEYILEQILDATRFDTETQASKFKIERNLPLYLLPLLITVEISI